MRVNSLATFKNSLLPVVFALALSACTNKAAAPAFEEHPVKVNTISVKFSNAP